MQAQCASVSAEVGTKGADIEMCAQGLPADLAGFTGLQRLAEEKELFPNSMA